MNIGEKIKLARINKGMTQEELGNAIGVQKSAIAKYENGRVINIKRTILKKLSDVLNIAPSELIFENYSVESEKKNDAIADIILKLRTDNDYLEVVQALRDLTPEQYVAVKTFLSAFKK